QQRARSLKVTFALDPEQTGLIAFVSKHGNFRLVLRSPKERSYQMLTAPTWERLSEYLEDQGIKIPVPAKSRPIDEDADLESIEVEEVQPYIQIFRAGEEL
ncbi:MAG: hypothetical protein GY861_23930, partial [bacterium]|nr:hypothetical protein [bacterium]